MKALSVRQPYAGLIAEGMKTVECRSWQTSHRGDILICSSSQWAPGNYKIPPEKIDFFTLGVALCIVNLYDIVSFTKCHLKGACMDKYVGGNYAWLLKNPRVIEEPFKVRGKLRLFEVDINIP